MRGQILQVKSGSGLILGGDGRRYRFTASDWKGDAPPVVGGRVDFVPGAELAGEVFPLPPVAGLRLDDDSSVLLGVIGILCLIVGFVVPVLPTFVAFIVGLVGADSAKRHGNATGLALSRIAWIGALVVLMLGLLFLLLAWAFAVPIFDMFIRQFGSTGGGWVTV